MRSEETEKKMKKICSVIAVVSVLCLLGYVGRAQDAASGLPECSEFQCSVGDLA